MNPFQCEQVLLSAMARADGEAAPLEDSEVKQHLDHCAACRQTVASLDPTKLVPAGLARERPDDDLWPAIKKRIQQEQPGRQPWRYVLAAAACLLLAVGGLFLIDREQRFAGKMAADFGERMPVSAPMRPMEDGPQILSFPEVSDKSSKPLPEYYYEQRAEVIAIGVMGRPFFHKGQKLLELKLLEILKGNPGGRDITSSDGIPPFGCIPPKDPKTFSELTKQGARVVVYLEHTARNGWRPLILDAIDAENEKRFRDRVQPYLDVVQAAEAKDPAARYRELILSGGKLKFGSAEYHALMHTGDRRAAPVVRELFALSIGPNAPSPREQYFLSPHALVALLGRLQDAGSVELVLKYAPRLPEHERVEFVSHLVPMCSAADAATVAAARAQVKMYVENYKGDRKQAAYQRLKETYDSLDKLPR
ncbi:MAG: zf-HC2 domain-containing protein [Gemmataceae bacterium]